jgi:hypothetical protein
MAKTAKTKKSVKKSVPVVESVLEGKSPSVAFKFPKKLFIYGLLFLATGTVMYFGGKILFAASVNGQLVSRIDVVKELEKQGGKKTLDVFILKTLISQEAKKRKVAVSQKDVDAEIAKIEKNVATQGATLESLLAQQGMTKANLVDEIRLQLLVTKMVGNDAVVTDKEIDDYIKAQSEQMALSSLEQPEAEAPSRKVVKEQIKQQKLQEKIQAFITDLREKAKIKYFINY